MSYATWEPLPDLDKSVLEGCIDVSRRKLLLDGKNFFYNVKKNIFYVPLGALNKGTLQP